MPCVATMGVIFAILKQTDPLLKNQILNKNKRE
jgi:hypothetical protein